MREQIGELPSVPRNRFLTRSRSQALDKGHERFWVVTTDQTIRCRICLVGVERLLRYNPSHALLRRALEQV